jgi:hypothetical protein
MEKEMHNKWVEEVKEIYNLMKQVEDGEISNRIGRWNL